MLYSYGVTIIIFCLAQTFKIGNRIMTIEHTVNMMEFASYCGINKSYLSNLLNYPKTKSKYVKSSSGESVWIDVPQPKPTHDIFYKGLKIPRPVCGDYYATRKKWRFKEIKAFKRKLDRLMAKYPESMYLNPKTAILLPNKSNRRYQFL